MDIPQFFNNIIKRKKINERNIKMSQQDEAIKIQDDLVQKLKESFYFNIDKIEPEHLFQYIIVTIISIYLASKSNIQLKHIFGLFIGILISFYFFSQRNIYTLSDKNQLEMKLKLIYPSPQYFDIHPDLVIYFFNIREYRNYNPIAHDSALKAVDDFMHLYRDIITLGVKDCHQNIDEAVELMRHAINNIHSIIHTTPIANITHAKLEESLDVMNSILTKYLDEMVYTCNDQLKKIGNPRRIYISPVKSSISKSIHFPKAGFEFYA